MTESAAHLVDQVIPRESVRQWVLSFPVPLRILFAAPAEVLAPVLRIIHRVIAAYLLKHAGLKRTTADTGAVTPHPISRASARSKRLSPSGREAGSEGAGEYRSVRLGIPAFNCC